MLRSSEASRSFRENGMLGSEDFAQHDNSALICKEDIPLDEPCLDFEWNAVFAGQKQSICAIQKLDVTFFDVLAVKNGLIDRKIGVDPCSPAFHFLVLQT